MEQLKVKSEVVPVVIRALGAVTPKQEEWLQQILVNTSEVSVYKSAVIKLQNTVVKYQPYFTLYCYNLLMHMPTPFS